MEDIAIVCTSKLASFLFFAYNSAVAGSAKGCFKRAINNNAREKKRVPTSTYTKHKYTVQYLFIICHNVLAYLHYNTVFNYPVWSTPTKLFKMDIFKPFFRMFFLQYSKYCKYCILCFWTLFGDSFFVCRHFPPLYCTVPHNKKKTIVNRKQLERQDLLVSKSLLNCQ